MSTETLAPPGHRFRAMLSGVGPCSPIEERIGTRLLRLVPPESDEGVRLLRSGSVEFVGPEGEDLGRMPVDAALHGLRAKLELRLGSASAEGERDALQDGLELLDDWTRRCREV